MEAAAAELACAFVFQAALMHVLDLKEQLRVPLVAATITALVYAGAWIIASQSEIDQVHRDLLQKGHEGWVKSPHLISKSENKVLIS